MVDFLQGLARNSLMNATKLPSRRRSERAPGRGVFWCGCIARAAIIVVAVIVATTTGHAQANRNDGDAAAEFEAITKNESEPQFGDLDAIEKRRLIRVLVSYSMTDFFIVDGRARGFEYEFAKAYEKFLNQHKKRSERIRMVFVPVPFDQLIPALRQGHGDIIAASLTITPERSELVQFSQPFLPSVDEIVVANENIDGLQKIDDLSGRTVMLVAGSSQIPRVDAISNELVERGKTPIEIQIAPGEFEAEDVLEVVNAGIADATIAKNYVAKLWTGVLPDVVALTDLIVDRGGENAWAVRLDSPQLLASINAFVSKHRRGTLLGNILFKRYFEDRKWISNPAAPEKIELLGQYAPLFKEFAAEYGFDWQLIAALAYQESQFDQKQRSNRGAIGLMQIKEETAHTPEVGIRDITTAKNNVNAGVKYLAFLRDTYFSEPKIGTAARIRFALAAYNAGPAAIARMRKIATRQQLDQNKWFGNVENVTLRHLGSQPVTYVANIEKYYYAYRLSNRELTHRRKELDALGATSDGN